MADKIKSEDKIIKTKDIHNQWKEFLLETEHVLNTFMIYDLGKIILNYVDMSKIKKIDIIVDFYSQVESSSPEQGQRIHTVPSSESLGYAINTFRYSHCLRPIPGKRYFSNFTIDASMYLCTPIGRIPGIDFSVDIPLFLLIDYMDFLSTKKDNNRDVEENKDVGNSNSKDVGKDVEKNKEFSLSFITFSYFNPPSIIRDPQKIQNHMVKNIYDGYGNYSSSLEIAKTTRLRFNVRVKSDK